MEIQEREEQLASEAKVAAERATHNELMLAANLDGVESLADDMVGGLGGHGAWAAGVGRLEGARCGPLAPQPYGEQCCCPCGLHLGALRSNHRWQRTPSGPSLRKCRASQSRGTMCATS